MTKLNHNRPYLKYIDNLRREIAIQSRRSEELDRLSQRPTNASNDAIFPLTDAESSLVEGIFVALTAFQETEITLLTAVSPKATKAQKLKAKGLSYEPVQAALDFAVLKFASLMTIGAISGRMNLTNLYSKVMQPELKKDGGVILEQLDESMRKAFENISKTLDKISTDAR